MKKNSYICRRMFFRVLWPSLISAIALAIANMADALAVGNHMGELGLAAIGVVTPLYMLYNVVGLAFSVGGCVTHSRLTAAGQNGTAVAHFKLLAWVLSAVSVVIGVLGLVLLNPILALLGAGTGAPELHRLCREYAMPLFIGAPLFLLNFLAYDFVRCDDGSRLATLGFSVGCLADAGLNILFVLVLGWGVGGSAWASVIAQFISILIISQHFASKKSVLNNRAIHIWKIREDKEAVRLFFPSIRLGFTTSGRYIFQFLFLLMGNRLLLAAGRSGHINGEIYVAIFDVVMNVSYLVYGIYQAFSDTMQPLASTFAAEHGRDNLRYLIRLAIRMGLLIGCACTVLIAVLALPIARLFGVSEADALTVAAKAIPIFCLSTPFAGVTIILMGFYQSTGKELLASLAALFRTLVFLLPTTLAAGWLFPRQFWWLFLICETGSLLALLFSAWIDRTKHADRDAQVPVFSAVMDQQNHEVARVLAGVEEFCEQQEIPPARAMFIQLAAEELSVVTIQKAFTGRPDEYIQITLAKEENGDYVMHIRNSAPFFNPLAMRMGRVSQESQEDIMESVGVLMVKRRAKDVLYRNYQGFNVLTVIL